MNIAEATEKVQETKQKVKRLRDKTGYKLTMDITKLANYILTVLLMVFSGWYLFTVHDRLLADAKIYDFVAVALLVRTMFKLK